MKLSELISKVGDDRVQVQILARDFKSAAQNKGNATITFNTSPQNVFALLLPTGELPKRIGLVVWFDRSDYETAMAEIRRESAK